MSNENSNKHNKKKKQKKMFVQRKSPTIPGKKNKYPYTPAKRQG